MCFAGVYARSAGADRTVLHLRCRVDWSIELFRTLQCIPLSRADRLRYHIVEEFNKGVYDYIIATDEADLGGDEDESESEGESEDEEETAKEGEVAEDKKRE